MKTKLQIAALCAIILHSVTSAQTDYKEDVVDSDDLFAPFRTVYRGQSVEFVNNDDHTQEGSALLHRQKMVHQAMNGGLQPYRLQKIGKMGIVTSTQDVSTIRTASPKGRSISQRNHESKVRQINRQAAFAEKRRQERLAAAERAAAIKAEKERREREADNRRVAHTEAQTNARLQGRTDANIRRDYYNAGEGRIQARQTAVNNANAAMRGPLSVSVGPAKVSGADYAANLRRNRQRDRSLTPRKQSLQAPIIRYVAENNGYTFTGRATKTAIFIKKDPRFGSPKSPVAPKTLKSNHGFVLSPNAVITTGRNKEYEDPHIFVNPRQIPPPVTALNKKGLTDEEMWQLKLKELLPDEHS